jgi:hypothetical protein
MADRRGLAGVAVYRNGSRGLFQVGCRASRVYAAALSTVPHDHNLCPLRIRTCGKHGHLCGWHLRLGPASGKRYLTPRTACIVDRLFDDGADRLYCGSPLLFVEQIGAHRTPFSNNGKQTTVSDPLYSFSLPMRNPDAPIFVLISISDCQYVIDKWLGNRTGMLP